MTYQDEELGSSSEHAETKEVATGTTDIGSGTTDVATPTGSVEFRCGICDQTFSSNTALAAHSLRCRKNLPDD